MSIERFLQFVMSHNATIIEILFGLTLLGVLFLAVRSFLLAKDPSGGGAALDMGNLETMLQQILEKAGQIPSAAGAGAGSTEDSQRLIAEITNLKTDLEAKKKQIDEMKTAAANTPAPAAGGLSSEEKASLDDKIRELQAKLSEYEIISEDIADLSFYKEQNAKLQKELDSMKAGGAPVAAPAPAPVAAAAPPPPPREEPAIVGKATVTETPADEVPVSEPIPAPAASAAAPAAAELAIDDDLMAEFAAAVEKQKAPEAAAAPIAPAASEAAAPKTEAPKTEASAASREQAEVSLGEMDMDKMLAEAAGIKNDGPEVSAEAALGTSMDENKLLQEAAALNSVSAEDKKLMGDFENFVKKGES
jgi:hypothetical protein